MPDSGRSRAEIVVDVDRPAGAPTATVRVRGEIDLATAPGLEHRLEPLLAEGVQRLVVDLTQVPFCDLSGLNVLLHLQSRLRSHGGGLTVRAACPSLRLMISALRLDGALPLARDVDHAGRDGTGPE